jgi:hypothetical protein
MNDALAIDLTLGFSESEWQRYYQLVRLRQEESLTEAQHLELINLTDRLEHANNRRLKALIALAKTRNVTLEQVMADMGITTPDVS